MQWRAVFCIDHDHVKSQVKVLVALQSLFQLIFFRSHGPSGHGCRDISEIYITNLISFYKNPGKVMFHNVS